MPTGLPTGLGLERRVPGGIPKDKVTTIFAESGNFKTTFVGHMQLAMAAEGHRCMFVSLEDSKELAAHRFLARTSGLNYGSISGGTLTKAEVGKLGFNGLARSTADRVWIVDDVEPSIHAILELATQAPGLDCVAIDYIQLLTGRGQKKDVLDEAVVASQAFAKKHKVAVILVSQQKQEKELERDDPRPRVGDMLGSSAMRIGSKLILALFRPWLHCKVPTSLKGPYGMYGRYTTAAPSNIEQYPRFVEVHVLKNVLGESNVALHVLVNPATGVIENADSIMAPYL